MRLGIAVCDDEKAVCEYLRDRITDLLARWDINGTVTVFNDGEPLAAAFESGQADFNLIFLDITMKSCDGLSAAKRIRAVDKDVMIVLSRHLRNTFFRGTRCGHSVIYSSRSL